MNRVFFVAVAALLTAGVSVRGDDKVLPKGPPPKVVSVLKVDKNVDVIEYREFWPLPSLPTKEGAVKPGDPGEPLIGAPIYLSVKFPLKSGSVYDAAGNKVDAETVKKRLAVGDSVLVSGDFKPVDPAYLKVFTKDVLILVTPPPPHGPALPSPVKQDK